MLKVGVDVGGTFTDVYGTDGSKVFVGKSLTTPDDLSTGIMNSIAAAKIDVKEIDVLVHGSTIATNALITKNYYGWWPRTVFITSEGFRDTLEIRRGRNQLFGQIDMYGTAPEPLVERQYRFTLKEKVDVEGNIVVQPNQKELTELVSKLKELKPDSLAICFINSYKNASNEMTVKEQLQKEFPDIPVYASVEVAPKFRELGRMITVTTRSLLAPIVTDYMNKIEKKFGEHAFKGQLLMIKGDGGTCTTDFIKKHPEMLIGSGPAAGVYAGEALGQLLGEENLLTQDTGGTSYDVCVIENGQHLRTFEYEIDLDMPLVVPMTDVRSIGTGGGSIIWIDEGESLRVGPQSAGAKPGPICYGLGGMEPTITDANLLLGRIDKSLGGKMELDFDLTKKIFQEKLAGPLGKDVFEVAEGAINIACVNMARANALITTSRGRDPRQYLPVLFGGAGGMHACKVSDELGVSKAVIVPNSGVASALGATMMPFSTYAEKTYYIELDSPDIEVLNDQFAGLKEKVVQDLTSQGIDREDILMHKELHMRYVGQNYEILVKESIDFEFRKDTVDKLKTVFNETHLQERAINEPKFPVAIVDIRVMASNKTELVKPPVTERANDGIKKALKGERKVYFEGNFANTPVYDFNKLSYGHVVDGPAVIEMSDSCVDVTPEWKASIDQYQNMILERR